MNIKETLKNYRTDSLKIAIAKANNRMTVELIGKEKDLQTLDMAIDYLKPEYQMVIHEHFIDGISYARLARNHGFEKSTMAKKVNRGIIALEKILK